MPPSEPAPTERPLPTAEDFPATGPYSLAAPGPRFAGRALDLALLAAPALLVVALTTSIVGDQLQFDVPIWLLPAVAAVGVVYEALCVAAFGRTLGKAVAGLRVVRYTDGQRPAPAQALLRAMPPWGALALPLGPFSIAAMVCVFGTGVGGALHRGLPDQAGGTIVISTR